ncbi:MAG: Hsp70 family protein [Thalassobaculaceae bacterium]|nr:Hsp70 family protein [Thalassobaculaceae bacterium]
MTPTIAAGLDFGTSNSAIGFVRDGQPVLHRFADGRPLVPSALFYSEDEGTLLFGTQAEACFLAEDDGRYLRALKSILGTSLTEERTILGGRPWPFRQLLKRFVQFLKDDVERREGVALSTLVAGRPVRFNDDEARDAEAEAYLREIFVEAGFTDVRFLYEPVAAMLDASDLMETPEVVLVADIGGGTSDFSVARWRREPLAPGEERFEILANHGVRIGGTDLDRRISLDTVMPLLGLGSQTRSLTSSEILPVPAGYFGDLASWHKIHLFYSSKNRGEIIDIHRLALEPEKIGRLLHVMDHRLGHRLAARVEDLKIRLGSGEAAGMDLPDLGNMSVPVVDESRLQHAIRGELQSLRTGVHRTLELAGVEAREIDHVVLTGGTTLLPVVRETLAGCVPEATLVSSDPFCGVVNGLAKAAASSYAQVPA